MIADEPFLGEQNDPQTARHGLQGERPLFDAYTTYNMFENPRVREGETAASSMQRQAYPIFARWAASTDSYPNVMPSYHDFRGHHPLAGCVDGSRSQLQPPCEQQPSRQLRRTVHDLHHQLQRVVGRHDN